MAPIPDGDRAVELVKEVTQRDAALPSITEVASIPGSVRVPHANDAGYDVRVVGAKGNAMLNEMLRPWRRKADDVGKKLHSDTPTVLVSRSLGEQREVPVGAERRLYAAGFRARIKGRRRRITSESEIRARIEADK